MTFTKGIVKNWDANSTNDASFRTMRSPEPLLPASEYESSSDGGPHIGTFADEDDAPEREEICGNSSEAPVTHRLAADHQKVRITPGVGFSKARSLAITESAALTIQASTPKISRPTVRCYCPSIRA